MTEPRTTARRFAVATLGAIGLLLAACGSDDAGTETTTTAVAPASDIETSGAWARTSPMVATAGAVYLDIRNTGSIDDALVDAAVDDSVAARAELHETVTGSPSTQMGDGGGMTSSTMGEGMMSMQEVDEIPIPAGGSVSLEPGGYHVMLLDLTEPLEEGTTVAVTLTFEQAGEVVVEAEVRDEAP